MFGNRTINFMAKLYILLIIVCCLFYKNTQQKEVNKDFLNVINTDSFWMDYQKTVNLYNPLRFGNLELIYAINFRKGQLGLLMYFE